MTKVQSHVILVLHNLKMVPSIVRKKNTSITKCGKSTVICDVDTTQCDNRTIIFEKRKIELPNMTKVQSHVILVLHNLKIVPSNVRKKKYEYNRTWQKYCHV